MQKGKKEAKIDNRNPEKGFLLFQFFQNSISIAFRSELRYIGVIFIKPFDDNKFDTSIPCGFRINSTDSIIETTYFREKHLKCYYAFDHFWYGSCIWEIAISIGIYRHIFKIDIETRYDQKYRHRSRNWNSVSSLISRFPLVYNAASSMDTKLHTLQIQYKFDYSKTSLTSTTRSSFEIVLVLLSLRLVSPRIILFRIDCAKFFSRYSDTNCPPWPSNMPKMDRVWFGSNI